MKALKDYSRIFVRFDLVSEVKGKESKAVAKDKDLQKVLDAVVIGNVEGIAAVVDDVLNVQLGQHLPRVVLGIDVDEDIPLDLDRHVPLDVLRGARQVQKLGRFVGVLYFLGERGAGEARARVAQVSAHRGGGRIADGLRRGHGRDAATG